MMFHSAKEVLDALVHAYYEKRDIEAVLACVTDDVEWVGTEEYDSAKGKAALKKLLEADTAAFPEAFQIKRNEPDVQVLGSDVVIITMTGDQVALPGTVCGFSIRGTVCCVRTEQGWLAANVHMSVPNAELEKYSLERELDDNRKKEKTLLSGIPGGVAIYRLKKNGKICTDYVSDGLAKMCGYETGDEFRDYLQSDALINVVKEDIPRLQAEMQESMEQMRPISTMYRIHVKDREDILQRLDANRIEGDLGADDVAAWYAVHTIVSDASKQIMQEQKRLQKLMDHVPVGIGIYEADHGKISLNYVNNAFYKMLGSDRESRKEFFGENTLKAVHPEDVRNIKGAVCELLDGADNAAVSYRLKTGNGEWIWVNLNGAVVERREDYLKVYAAFSDYNAVMRSKIKEEETKVTLNIAMQSAKVLAWKYDTCTRTIIDTMTLGDAYHLPNTIAGLPESILATGYLAEESEEEFAAFINRISTAAVETVDVKTAADADGRFTWYRIIDTPVYNAGGNYTGSIGTALDITEQKEREFHYEEQLRLNQVAAQEALSKVYINLSKNQVTSCDASSEAFSHHAGIKTADELLGNIKCDITEPEEADRFKIVENCQTILDSFRRGNTHFEINCHLHDFSKWTKVIYDVLENPYTGDIEMISSIHDVTEQMRAELVVHKLMDVAYKSIILVDNKTGEAYPFKRDEEDGNVDEINQGIHAGSQKEGLEEFFRTHARPEDADTIIRENSPETIKAALEHNPYYESIYSLQEKGKIVRYKVTYAYLENDRRILLSAVQDVTKLYEKELQQKKELECALVEADAANKAKTAFLSRISHDMRTPLNGILGLTELMKDSITDEKVFNDLSELEISGKYLLNLINDTLDVSRIESGKMELHPVVYEEKAFFNNAISLAKTTIEAKNIRYHIHEESIAYAILYDDVARMEQVILNVVSNAVKFTPEDGTIDIIVRNISADKEMVVDQIIVQDTGIGISPEFVPHIFEAFSQEDASRTSSAQGTGLGMSITRQLLNLMGGDITVASEPGQGSCFTIILRLHVATEKQIAAWKENQIDAEVNAELDGKHILVCEDHPLNAAIATRLLETKGMLVEHARDGQIGYEMFCRSKEGYYDAILMDIRMPVMDGLDTAKAIRALQRPDAQRVPIIAMTANAFKEDIQQTKKAGMNAHLSKPIQPQSMYLTLAKLINLENR